MRAEDEAIRVRHTCRGCGQSYDFLPEFDPPEAAIWCSPECSIPPECRDEEAPPL